jgi:hypothetical protein
VLEVSRDDAEENRDGKAVRRALEGEEGEEKRRVEAGPQHEEEARG